MACGVWGRPLVCAAVRYVGGGRGRMVVAGEGGSGEGKLDSWRIGESMACGVWCLGEASGALWEGRGRGREWW